MVRFGVIGSEGAMGRALRAVIDTSDDEYAGGVDRAGDPATLAAFRPDPRRDAQSRAARLARTGPPLRAAARVEGHGARAPPMDADRI